MDESRKARPCNVFETAGRASFKIKGKPIRPDPRGLIGRAGAIESTSKVGKWSMNNFLNAFPRN
jgi:hypothetical protein